MTASPEATAALPTTWEIREAALSLERPLLMGILNVTPDSFSDGGRFHEPRAALERALRLREEGADLLDVGGESTRPGAAPVDAAEELARVLPVLRLLREHLDLPLSIDTRRAEVARAALAEGASIVNDVSALGHDPAMAGMVAEAGAGLVLMHMRGTPRTMQSLADYDDVAAEVANELEAALENARAAGIGEERIVLDPGVGFAKSAAHNFELIGRLQLLARLGRPLLLGPSRKAFLGSLLGLPPEERGVGTAAACVAGLLGGARIFRVHDVAIVRQALEVAEAIRRASPGAG